jgi:bacterioferritin-associated ferredoxin
VTDEQADELIASHAEAYRILKEIVSQCDQGGKTGKVFARDDCIRQARKWLEENEADH